MNNLRNFSTKAQSIIEKHYSYEFKPESELKCNPGNVDLLSDVIKDDPNDEETKKVLNACLKYKFDVFISDESLVSDRHSDCYEIYDKLINDLKDNSKRIEELFNIDQKHYLSRASVYETTYNGKPLRFLLHEVHDMGGINMLFFNKKDADKFGLVCQ